MDDLKENNIRTEDKKITRLPLTSDYVFKRIFAREENNSMYTNMSMCLKWTQTLATIHQTFHASILPVMTMAMTWPLARATFQE